MRIKKLYRDFLRKFVDNKYLQNYPNVTVLAENFINGYYVLIFESLDTTVEEKLWKGITMS